MDAAVVVLIGDSLLNPLCLLPRLPGLASRPVSAAVGRRLGFDHLRKLPGAALQRWRGVEMAAGFADQQRPRARQRPVLRPLCHTKGSED